MIEVERAKLLELAARVEAATGADRQLADEALLACGWQLNHDADDIAAWRIDPGTCEGEDGADHPVTLDDRMRWACWYPPGSRPFRDSWIDGHYRPNPLASVDAAMSLVPKGHWAEGALGSANDTWASIEIHAPTTYDPVGTSTAASPALAVTAAALRALAAQVPE